ncbi:MAG: tetratricopeptide repeat protein, partial [Myxococcota bacterium]
MNPAVPNPGTVSPTFDRPATPGGIAVPAPAQRARPLNLKPPVKPQQVVTEEQLRAQVERMVQAYRLGDYTKFKLELAELENMRTQAGIANIVLASSALIRHAQSALSSGVFDRAHELSSAAVRLSPDLVAARWTHLNILWATDWTRIRPISGAAVGLVSAQFGSFRNQISALTSILLIVGLAALITIMAFAVMQLFKYVRYPAHDIAARLPAVIGTPQVVFALLLAVITPMAFGWGPVVSTIFALVIIVGYQSATEQAVSRTILGLIVAVPLCLVAVAPLITFHGSLVDDMATAISDAFASQAEQRLFATSSTRRDRDPTSAMILARRKRLRGDLPGADLAYERALEIRPGDPVALNNRGVVQFMLGHHEAAVSLFARGAAVEHVESILNLATVRAEQGAFEEASTLMERANRIAGDLDDYARSPEDGTDASKLLYEAEIDSSALWGHLLEVDRDAWWVVAQSIWSRVGATPLWLVSVLALVALVFSAFIASRRDRLSAACPKCGTPASRNAYGQLCEQCT